MKRKKNDRRLGRRLFSVRNYIIFFLLVSFIVTCSLLVFLYNIELNYSNIQEHAVFTFINVLFLSFLCFLFDGIRRKYTVERPLKHILNATRQLTQGDFTARIQPFHRFHSTYEFNAIIHDFNKMAEELSGIETMRTDFIANVSHEIKTPLAIIQNYMMMLQASSLSEEKRIEYTKIVIAATRRLSDLITNILKLNKLENQQIYPEVKKYNLSEQLSECLINFENDWERKNLGIDNHIEHNVMIEADEELMTLVWNNLFSNAIKFTGEGGKISVSLKEKLNCVIVEVSDTGCGMTPEIGQHIFEKFYQGDLSHSIQGNGLGLALVKRVMDITGGEITVKSTISQGSTFTVILRKDST